MGAPRKYEDPAVGTRFGHGVVLELASYQRSPNRPNKERGARLRCDCGTEYLADLAALYTGARKSCGCKRKKRGIVATPGYAQHPLYCTWHGMIDRCYNPDVSNYRLYGGLGITVCDAWRGLDGMANFAEYIERELGPRKPGDTLDRINTRGNYEPGNVRWASKQLQGANYRGAELDWTAMKIWAIRQGLPVKFKGRVRAEIVEAYLAAHPKA